MAVAGAEPISASNLQDVVDALVSRQESLAATFATVAQFSLESSGLQRYKTAFRLVSSNGIGVSIEGADSSGCVLTFQEPGVYQVSTASGFAGKVIDSGGYELMTVNGAQTFSWDATSGQPLTLAGTYVSYSISSQVTVTRVS